MTIMGRHTGRKLRRLYADVWHRQYPHDDKTLAILWFEAKRECGVSAVSKQIPEKVWQEVLEKMRYDD